MHSKISLTYRIRGLKPKPLRRIEDWTAHTIRGAFDAIPGRTFFAYSRHSVELTARALIYLIPLALVVLGMATVVLGPSTTLSLLSETSNTIQETPYYVAGIVVAAYSLALLTYKPVDVNDYMGRSTPTLPDEWEVMLQFMGSGMYPLSFFLLHWHPDAHILMDATGFSPFRLGIIGGLLGQFVVLAWYKHRHTNPNGGVSPRLDTLYGSFMFSIPGWILYLALITYDIDFLVFGPSDQPTVAGFYILAVWTAFILRRLRWTVYEDWAEFRTVHPTVQLWGIPRLVFLFSLVSFWAGAPLADPVVLGIASPFVAGLAYIVWRFWETGDNMVDPNGGPGAGRNAYKRVQKENNRKARKIGELSDAIGEFNEFANKHGMDTLPDQSIINYKPGKVRSQLDEIDKVQARRLTGDNFTDYAEHRDKVRRKLN